MMGPGFFDHSLPGMFWVLLIIATVTALAVFGLWSLVVMIAGALT